MTGDKVDFSPYAVLKYRREGKAWFALADRICRDNQVEIWIESAEPGGAIESRLLVLTEFISWINTTMSDIFLYMETALTESKFAKTAVELKEMYTLSAITLKDDGESFWVVLEPKSDVESVYNFFPRFTVVNSEITWSNLG